MNILIANTQEFNPLIGGVERVSTLLTHELVKLGYNVYFLAYHKSPFSKPYKPPVTQFFLPNINEISSQENIDFFLKIIKEKKIDIVLNQAGNIVDFSNLCMKVNESSSIKLLSALHINPDFKLKQLQVDAKTTIHNFYHPKFIRRKILYFSRKKKIFNYYKKFYNKLYNESDKIVLLSERYYSVFSKFVEPITDDKLVAIPNPNTLYPDDKDLINKEKIILYVGRLDYAHKRPDRIITIWNSLEKEFPEWNLKIVGDGPYLSHLRKKVNALHLKNVEFLGFVNPLEYYSQASILCMTSNIEGWPLVLNEALCFGTIPFAFTSFESIYDILDDGKTGYLIKPYDLKTYTNQLRLLMSDENKLYSMAQNAITSSNRFDKNKIIDKWINLFNE